MRRLALPVLRPSAAPLVLSLAGTGIGEGDVAAAMFGVALGAVPHPVSGSADHDSGDGAFADAVDIAGGDA